MLGDGPRSHSGWAVNGEEGQEARTRCWWTDYCWGATGLGPGGGPLQDLGNTSQSRPIQEFRRPGSYPTVPPFTRSATGSPRTYHFGSRKPSMRLLGAHGRKPVGSSRTVNAQHDSVHHSVMSWSRFVSSFMHSSLCTCSVLGLAQGPGETRTNQIPRALKCGRETGL